MPRGSFRHRSEFDARRDRVGVSFRSKQFDHTVNGRVRLPRRRPSIELAALVHYDGTQAKGTVVDYNVRSARISLEKSFCVPPGETVRISFGTATRRLYDGAATVIRAEKDSSEFVVEFVDNLLELRSITLAERALFANGIIDEKCKKLENFAQVSPEYRAFVSDWRMYLEMVEEVLDQEEAKGYLIAPDEQRLYLEEILPGFTAHMREFISRLNRLASTIDPAETEPYKLLLHDRLERFERHSPLASSMADRLHGYHGDFETVKYFFSDPFLGSSLFGKLMNRFVTSLEPVVAHRHRIEYLKREILDRYESSENGIRVLSLGSGPAEEILRLLDSRPEFDRPLHIALIDMDPHALADFYERAQFRKRSNVDIELVNFNVINILVGKRPT